MDFESLYDELRDPLTRRLERLMGDARTAEDLRQEAFARAWKSGPRDAGRGHMRAWLHRTAHNLLELPRHRFAIGVQWHPEQQGGAAAGDQLATALVEAAR